MARARKSPLRVVAADEIPPAPKSVTEAAEQGTTRELLVAMRARIAKAVEAESTPPRDLAALTKRLIEVAHDIETIDARDGQEAESVARRDRDDSFDAAAI